MMPLAGGVLHVTTEHWLYDGINRVTQTTMAKRFLTGALELFAVSRHKKAPPGKTGTPESSFSG